MSRPARLAAAVGISILVFLLLPWLTVSFIPDSVLLDAANRQLAPQGLTLQAQRLGRPFPLGLSATGLSLADSSQTWLQLDQLTVRLKPSSLLLGRLTLAISGQVGSGILGGSYTIWPRPAGKLAISNLDLSAIPLLTSSTGGTLKGLARLDLDLRQPGKATALAGSAQLQIRDVELRSIKLSGMQLPDVSCPELRGILKLQGQTITVDNLALQGNGIYLRLGGTLPLAATAPLNLQLELLPTAEFLDQQKSLFLIMLPYQQSPGAYRIRIGGTLGSPQLLGR